MHHNTPLLPSVKTSRLQYLNAPQHTFTAKCQNEQNTVQCNTTHLYCQVSRRTDYSTTQYNTPLLPSVKTSRVQQNAIQHTFTAKCQGMVHGTKHSHTFTPTTKRQLYSNNNNNKVKSHSVINKCIKDTTDIRAGIFLSAHTGNSVS